MAARRIRALCKRNEIYIRQIRVKHLELTLGYMGKFFNNGSITMKLHILKVLYGLESHAKDGRCGLSRNGDIRRFVGKLVEKQTLHVVDGRGVIFRGLICDYLLLVRDCLIP